MYGATSADFTITSGGRVIPGAVLTLWSARTGGTQITDLLDRDSVACTTVTSAADGSVVYYGPNNDKTVHWADSGQGSRVAIRPVDITGEPPTLTVGTVTTGTADVTISGTSPEYTLDFVLPPVGANGVNTAAIQDSAVTSAKIADGTITSTDVAADTFAAFGTVGNLLTANQASGTDTLGDTTGFTASGATLTSSTTSPYQGSKCLLATATNANARTMFGGDTASGTIPVIGGDTYTFIARLRSTSVTKQIRLRIYWWTSAGNVAASTASVNGDAVTLSSSWLESRLVAVAPSNAAFASLAVLPVGGDFVSSDTYSMDALSFHRGAAGTFSLPGVPVVGGSHIATNGAVHLSGTGVPESVITAAPGSTWLQTDSTTDVKGWLRWVKATGTGSTGWVAGAEADTGWRVITSWDSSGTVTGTALTAGWAPRASTAGYIAIWRKGTSVQLSISQLVAAKNAPTEAVTTIPAGFRKTGAGMSLNHNMHLAAGASGGLLPMTLYAVPSAYALTAYGAVSTITTGMPFALSPTFLRWESDEAWPSSLPGVAA
jgi:hypothetical protein